MLWIIRNMLTGRITAHDGHQEATQSALAANNSSPDHPSFDLYLIDRDKIVHWRGFLWRAFGSDFADNPWNTKWEERP